MAGHGMPNFAELSAAIDALHDPQTDAAELAAIVRLHPSLRWSALAHPNADPLLFLDGVAPAPARHEALSPEADTDLDDAELDDLAPAEHAFWTVSEPPAAESKDRERPSRKRQLRPRTVFRALWQDLRARLKWRTLVPLAVLVLLVPLVLIVLLPGSVQEADPSNLVSEPTDLTIMESRVGDCVNYAAMALDGYQNVHVVPCDTTHDGEVFAKTTQGNISDANWAAEFCDAQFASYVGLEQNQSALSIARLRLTQGGDTAAVMCIAFQSGGDFTASLRGTQI